MAEAAPTPLASAIVTGAEVGAEGAGEIRGTEIAGAGGLEIGAAAATGALDWGWEPLDPTCTATKSATAASRANPPEMLGQSQGVWLGSTAGPSSGPTVDETTTASCNVSFAEKALAFRGAGTGGGDVVWRRGRAT